MLKEHTGIQEELMQLNSSDPREFWKRIGKIGVAAERRTNIPWEVVNEEGLIVTDEREVLDKWRNDYSGLLNFNHHTGALDDDPINVTTSIPAGIENPITLEEVSKALHHPKLGKVVGTDYIPTEVLQNETAKHFLYVLFHNYYEHSIISTMLTWLRGIINPGQIITLLIPETLCIIGVSLLPVVCTSYIVTF